MSVWPYVVACGTYLIGLYIGNKVGRLSKQRRDAKGRFIK